MIEKIDPPSQPRTGARDAVEVGVAGLLGLVPGAGGWLSAGFQKVFAQQEQNRLNAYLANLAAVINRLTETVEGLTAEQLASTPEFYDAAVTAARIATATASEQKQRALRNALFHLGSEGAPDTDLRMVFIRYIDELTDTHVRVLQYFASAGGEYIHLDDTNSITGSEAASQPFVADLQTRGMIEERPIITRHGGGMTMFANAAQGGSRITSIGTQFLEFIAGPFD